jgi:hypothetical protein
MEAAKAIRFRYVAGIKDCAMRHDS